MLNDIKTKIVLAVQRQQVYDPVLKDTVGKVLVTFADGMVNGYLEEDWFWDMQVIHKNEFLFYI